MPSPETRVASMSNRWEVRVASPGNLFRALHDFLDDRGYVHEHESPKAEQGAVDGMTIFKGELIGKIDSPRRDLAYLIFGIILLPTILLTNLGLTFIKESRYTLRTIVRIGVEAGAYPAKNSVQDMVRRELPGVAGDARITLELEAGPARGDNGIWRPADGRRDVIRLAEERRELEAGLSELLLRIAQTAAENPQEN